MQMERFKKKTSSASSIQGFVRVLNRKQGGVLPDGHQLQVDARRGAFEDKITGGMVPASDLLKSGQIIIAGQNRGRPDIDDFSPGPESENRFPGRYPRQRFGKTRSFGSPEIWNSQKPSNHSPRNRPALRPSSIETVPLAYTAGSTEFGNVPVQAHQQGIALGFQTGPAGSRQRHVQHKYRPIASPA